MDLRIETAIGAPARTVWDILGRQFADIAAWSSTVQSSRALTMDEVPPHLTVADGAPVPGRETTTKAGTLREILTEYSDEDRVLTFHAAGLPRVFRLVSDRQAVHVVDANRSRVTFDVHVEGSLPVKLLAPLLGMRMRKTFGSVQDELRVRAEEVNAAEAQQ